MQASQHLHDIGLKLLRRGTRLLARQSASTPVQVVAVMHIGEAAEMLMRSVIVRSNVSTELGFSQRDSEPIMQIWQRQRLQLRCDLPFEQLPGLLFDCTGYHITRMDSYRQFNAMRRFLQQLGIPPVDLAATSQMFISDVLNPIVARFWPASVDLRAHWPATPSDRLAAAPRLSATNDHRR